MNKIKINTIENELYYKGEIIVRYRIEYPEILSTDSKVEIINYENLKAALESKEFIESTLYEQAKETYEYNKMNGNPIIVYELVQECNTN